MAIYECMEKFGKEDTIAALETLEYKEDTDYPIGGGLAPKRNKQVDVPTEAWQKRIERELSKFDKLDRLLDFFEFDEDNIVFKGDVIANG